MKNPTPEPATNTGPDCAQATGSALLDLLAAIQPFMPKHSGLCIDYSDPSWPVTEASCQCEPEAKRLRAAVRAMPAPQRSDPPNGGDHKYSIIPDSKIGTPQRGGPVAPLFGEFVQGGTLNVSGDEIIGCAIALTEEALRSAPRLPLYRRVAIICAEDYERLDRYCSALEEQLDSSGLQKAQHIAGLASQNAAVTNFGANKTP